MVCLPRDGVVGNVGDKGNKSFSGEGERNNGGRVSGKLIIHGDNEVERTNSYTGDDNGDMDGEVIMG